MRVHFARFVAVGWMGFAVHVASRWFAPSIRCASGSTTGDRIA